MKKRILEKHIIETYSVRGQSSGSGRFIRGVDGGGRCICLGLGGLGGSRFLLFGPGLGGGGCGDMGGGNDNSSGNEKK